MPGAALVNSLCGQQEIQMKFMDGRIRLMNEILNGIKILKFYAWEKAFLEQVLGHREKELRALKKSQILYSISIASFNSSSFLVRLLLLQVGWEGVKTKVEAEKHMQKGRKCKE